ncbi:MAG: phospholipase D-like domain-containing protein [Candidatus Eisenbacteria bacterium]
MRRRWHCLALVLACSGAPMATAVATTTPALQLCETRPLETTLGDSTLPTAQASWVEMIDGAKRTVDLEHFYLSHRAGQALQPVIDALGRASGRGVKVRLLLDAGIYATYPRTADSLATLSGVTLRRIDVKRQGGGIQHAKFMVVDRADAFIGSQNLDWRALSHIHELGVRMRDPVLAGAVARVFDRDWASSDTTRPAPSAAANPPKWPRRVTMPDGQADVWVGASPMSMDPGLPWDRGLVLARIHAARQEIVAQVLQYGVSGHGKADSTLHHALLAALKRGVKVKLIVSDWVVGGRNEDALRDLARHGAQVRISRLEQWSEGYIPFARVEHCKYLVTDSAWLWVGTSNWEPSYFLDSRNLGVVMHHVGLARQARGIFERSWTAPSALAFGPTTKLEKTEHGMTAPAGSKLYGE